ncbi:hypothetical protein WMY93_006734 [Mugilogobius chulae]|uniref:Uncharacterized protein n=1 Tax=Mugilogobius chulae TaxID=88201 RepID=A0AAW0PW76_9GOBI
MFNDLIIRSKPPAGRRAYCFCYVLVNVNDQPPRRPVRSTKRAHAKVSTQVSRDFSVSARRVDLLSHRSLSKTLSKTDKPGRVWRTESGEQSLENRVWRTESGEQSLENRVWRTESGEQSLENISTVKVTQT